MKGHPPYFVGMPDYIYEMKIEVNVHQVVKIS